MEYIAHRINTVKELESLPSEYGVELDLRDSGSRLILQHDPFSDGEDFEDYLKIYRHGTMILNIKSERIEWRVLELLNKYNIRDYFFLDSSFPMIISLSNSGEKNIAVRFSEYEKTDTIVAVADRVRWVWVDCFSRLPIDNNIYDMLRKLGLKLCLVSPELQAQGEKLEEYRDYLINTGIQFDAVCTKVHNIEKWQVR